MRLIFVGVAIILALGLSYSAFEAYSYQSLLSECKSELNLSYRDVTLYFSTTNTARVYPTIADNLRTITGVAEVSFMTPDDVQNEFLKKHAEDPDILNAILELGFNPFGGVATLTFPSSEYVAFEKDRIEKDIRSVSLQNGAIIESIDTGKAVNALRLKEALTKEYAFIPSLLSGHYWFNKGAVQGCSKNLGLF